VTSGCPISASAEKVCRHFQKLNRDVCRELLENMKTNKHHSESGKIGWILLWLVGIPVPILLILYFLRGCT
jgi:hypothetical protein